MVFVREIVSSLGGNERSGKGIGGGSREVGVPAPKPKLRASLDGAVTSVVVRAGAGTIFGSRGGWGGGCTEENPDCRGSLLSTGVLGALKPMNLGSIGRARRGSTAAGAVVDMRLVLRSELLAWCGDPDGTLDFRVELSSSSLLGGVLKGDTFRCPSDTGFVATSPRSGAGLMPRGFAGIFGLSARLTGGGIGDLGRAGGAGLIELAFSVAVGAFELRRCGDAGEDCLVEELLWCDTRSRTRAKALLSDRSGDLECALVKNGFGGEVGDSTLTDGVNCGDEPRYIDMGLFWFERVGDSEPLLGGPGVRGA